MGIDLFDVAFRVKKTFRIEMSEDDISGLVRDQDIAVGDLYEFVLRKLNLRDMGRQSVRLNSQLWAEMQAVLHFVSAMPLERIQLGTKLPRLFPRQTRRAQWTALQASCPYGVRELDYPESVRIAGFLLAVGVVFIEQRQIWRIPALNGLWPLLGLLGIWMVSETYLKVLTFCSRFRTRFPAGLKTAKDLCRSVLTTNYAEICANADIALDQRCADVWLKLVDVLVAALGVDPAEVTFQSRFVRDLGAD